MNYENILDLGGRMLGGRMSLCMPNSKAWDEIIVILRRYVSSIEIRIIPYIPPSQMKNIAIACRYVKQLVIEHE